MRGWNPHDGGPCPVDDHEIVDVRLRNGREGSNVAAAIFWHHDGRGDDVVAWRGDSDTLADSDGDDDA